MGTSQNDEYLYNILKIVLDHAYEGVAVIDECGKIIIFNEAYCRLKGVKKEDAIGRHVTEIIDNTRLHHVLKSGVPERGSLQTIAGQEMIVHRIPVWREGSVIAAIGMLVFDGVSELYQILERFEGNEKKESLQGKLPILKGKNELNEITFDKIIGRSEAILATKRLARKAAKTLATVLITGESGTGKELFAKAIHVHGPFSKGQFVSINCAAIPEQLLEAELFGYEEGAFTGARKGGKPGLFEIANEGTLFLDEIGDMPLKMQSKILRVLQEKEATRVGGVTHYVTNARIIAATNKNLFEMLKARQFREDLYYRLNIIPIHLPPLRARKGDIPLLLSKLMEETCEKYQIASKQFTAQGISKLIKYDWPGNVREMMNVVEQLVTLVDKEFITERDLPRGIFYEENFSVKKPFIEEQVFKQIKINRFDEERELIIHTLKETNRNKSKTAKLLGIHRSTLYEKLKKLEIP